MRRIVVSLLKGGVAKSETAVSLAHGLALKGCRVLLVDTDVQAQCNDMLGVEPEQGLAEVIAGWAQPLEALVQARENLFLLAGGVPLAGGEDGDRPAGDGPRGGAGRDPGRL